MVINDGVLAKNNHHKKNMGCCGMLAKNNQK